MTNQNARNPKIEALIEVLSQNHEPAIDDPIVIKPSRSNDNQFEVSDGTEWLVYTEDERDQAADESLEQYLDDNILESIPEALRGYFDREAWKRDAILSDGHGHILSSYDGEEHEVKSEVDGMWYYIYRTN